jgi:hypothetical protein
MWHEVAQMLGILDWLRPGIYRQYARMGDGPFIGPSRRTGALRLLAQTALVLAVVSVAGSAAAAANSITPSCESPPGVDLPDCSGWHTDDVRVTWAWDPLEADETSGCDIKTFSADTSPAGIAEQCVVRWGTVTLEATATIHLDKTAPVITGARPARPPDHDGWWTDPVAFTFVASDPASGVAACDTVTYSGPEGRGVKVAGGCRDVAGNSASATQPLNYDATPPSVGGLAILRKGGSAVLGWQTSADVVRSDVVRSLAADGAAATMIYSGSMPAAFDSTLAPDATYRYTVTAFDAAGNAASTMAIADPPDEPERITPSALRPADGARLSRPPLLRWKRVRRARYYNIQLFRNGRKVLSAWPRRNRLQLHRSWRFAGKRRHLTQGRYRWYVWPGRGARAERRYGRLIGSSRFYMRP